MNSAKVDSWGGSPRLSGSLLDFDCLFVGLFDLVNGPKNSRSGLTRRLLFSCFVTFGSLDDFFVVCERSLAMAGS